MHKGYLKGIDSDVVIVVINKKSRHIGTLVSTTKLSNLVKNCPECASNIEWHDLQASQIVGHRNHTPRLCSQAQLASSYVCIGIKVIDKIYPKLHDAADSWAAARNMLNGVGYRPPK